MNEIEADTIMEIYNLLGGGHSGRWIADKLGISTATVAEYRKVFVADEGEPVCGCGQSQVHKGRCGWRRQNEERAGEQVYRARRGKRSEMIFQFITENQPCRADEMITGDVSRGTISQTLSNMVKRNLIKRVGWGVFAMPDWEVGNSRNDWVKRKKAASEGNGGGPAEPKLELRQERPSIKMKGLPDMNLLEVAEVLNYWVANYNGPTDDPMAVEIVIALEHIKLATAMLAKRMGVDP